MAITIQVLEVVPPPQAGEQLCMIDSLWRKRKEYRQHKKLLETALTFCARAVFSRCFCVYPHFCCQKPA